MGLSESIRWRLNKLQRYAATKNAWKQIAKETYAPGKLLTNCIHAVLNAEALGPMEKDALDAIASKSTSFANSNEEIEMIDHGAGDSWDPKTQHEAGKGISRKKPLAQLHVEASTNPKWGELIFRLVRKFKPGFCLELGACLGISGSYQVQALRLNGSGKFMTIEGDPTLAKITSDTLNGWGYSNVQVKQGTFHEVLPTVLNKESQISMAFIDGHHDLKATLDYFGMIYPYLEDQAIVIFDDIDWNEGMQQAWEELVADKRTIYCVDLGKWGVCIIDKHRSTPVNRKHTLVF